MTNITLPRAELQAALDALDSDSPDIQLRAATTLRARLTQREEKPEPKPDVVGFCCVDRFSIDQDDEHNLRIICDGETGKLKKAEVIK